MSGSCDRRLRDETFGRSFWSENPRKMNWLTLQCPPTKGRGVASSIHQLLHYDGSYNLELSPLALGKCTRPDTFYCHLISSQDPVFLAVI